MHITRDSYNATNYFGISHVTHYNHAQSSQSLSIKETNDANKIVKQIQQTEVQTVPGNLFFSSTLIHAKLKQ